MRKRKINKINKIKLEEEQEKIDVLGQESDSKAKKWIEEDVKEQQKKQQKKDDTIMEMLDDKKNKKKVSTYKQILMQLLHDEVFKIGLPHGYEWGVWFDGKGIILAIRDEKGNSHSRAFKITNDPKYDLHAVHEFVVWAEDIYDLCRGGLDVIWTPEKKIN